jgi:amino-acid N-acetyltransferase
VAIAIQADKLIYLCDAPGLTSGKGEAIDALTADEAQQLVEKRVKQAPEIERVVKSAIRACRGGVARVHFLDRKSDGAMLMEFFTRDGIGTVMTQDPLAVLRDATIDDVGAVLALIEPLEADGTLVKRGRERLEMEISRFSVVEYDGMIVGCAALYPFAGEKAAELACLAVMLDFRRGGFGDQLRRHIEAKARKLKLKNLFVLTTRTAHWFIERGFVEVPIDQLPAKRRELYNFQRRSKVLMQAL